MRNKGSIEKGAVWIVDLGLAAKVRPCLLLTGFPKDEELALVTVVAHTTALRGNPWEVSIPKSFLKKGVFHLQQIHSIPIAYLERKLGDLNESEMKKILEKLKKRLSV